MNSESKSRGTKAGTLAGPTTSGKQETGWGARREHERGEEDKTRSDTNDIKGTMG